MKGYKEIIKSQPTRLKILKALRFIPDEPMVRLQYFIKTGRCKSPGNCEAGSMNG